MIDIPKKYISPLSVNNLDGRILKLPSESKRTPILLVYGHHSSLERMYNISRAFNDFGEVVVPDLPGFGGMTPLQDINIKPSIDNLADYLAMIVKEQFPRGKKFHLAGMSLGFVIALRMLQRHPDIQKQVKELVSVVGFTNKNDFNFTHARLKAFANLADVMSRRSPSKFFSRFILRKALIATTYHLRAKTHPKMRGFSRKKRKKLIDFEVELWQNNEAQTYFSTMYEMLTLKSPKKSIDIPVHHVAVSADQYFNNQHIKKNMEKIFSSVSIHEAKMPNHAPTIIEDLKSARNIIPESLGEVLK